MLKNEPHQIVDWSRVNKEDCLSAMERSPVRDVEIKHNNETAHLIRWAVLVCNGNFSPETI